jgi:hypothetical protein
MLSEIFLIMGWIERYIIMNVKNVLNVLNDQCLRNDTFWLLNVFDTFVNTSYIYKYHWLVKDPFLLEPFP